MTLKIGNVVNHEGALQWGAGKVLEVSATMATIQFSDGKERKIAASHFGTLQPANPSLYVPPAPTIPAEQVRPVARKTKKAK